MHVSTKRYGHEIGLSCVFRQWRAKDTHCRFLHGYALAVTLEFEAEQLDHRNWVVNFGGLKEVKKWLEDMFDHKLLIAKDDPDFDILMSLGDLHSVAQPVIVPNVGCESFAQIIGEYVQWWLGKQNDKVESIHEGVGAVQRDRVRLRRVTVAEHGANSAMWEPSNG